MKRCFICCVLFASACAVCSCASNLDEGMNGSHECSHEGSVYYCPNDKLCGDGECVDHSNANCSAFGDKCKIYEVCKLLETAGDSTAKEYACVCESDGKRCSGTCCKDGCKDLKTDNHNCMKCGNACGSNMICQKGCVPNCPSYNVTCYDAKGEIVCADVKTDPNYCGSCKVSCPDVDDPLLHLKGSYCDKGVCRIVCADGFENYDNKIENGCEKSLHQCNNGVLEPGEVCDGSLFGKQKTCVDFLGEGAVGKPVCNSMCSGIVENSCISKPSNTENCGNGIIDEGEICDGTAFPENSRTCADALNVENAGGTLGCTDSCRTIDKSACTYCGDGIVNGDEQCDSGKFKDEFSTCAKNGFTSGEITCNNAKCSVNTDKCTSCKDGEVKCEGLDQMKCVNGAWKKTITCSGKTPVCNTKADKTVECVECLSASDCRGGENIRCSEEHLCYDGSSQTYETDFEWLPDNINSSNYVEIKMSKYVKSITYEMVLNGRYDVSKLSGWSINGKGVSIGKSGSGFIEVQKLSKGVGTVSFNYNTRDKSFLTVSAGDAVKTAVLEKSKTGEYKVKLDNSGAVSFRIVSKSEDGADSKATGDARIVIDNLKWTDAP